MYEKGYIKYLLMLSMLPAQNINQSVINKLIKETTEQLKVGTTGKIILNNGYGFAHLSFVYQLLPIATHHNLY
jgi:hypothetical protein